MVLITVNVQQGMEDCLQQQAFFIQRRLSTPGRSKLDNLWLMTALLDLNIMEAMSPKVLVLTVLCVAQSGPFSGNSYSR